MVRRTVGSLAWIDLIYCVPSRLVADLWPAIEQYVQRAMNHHPFMEAQDVYALLHDGSVQLFIATREQKVTGFAAVEVVNYPRRKVANVLAAGGEHGFLSVLVQEVLPELIHWAKEQGADTFALTGRPGWVRVLRKLGFEVASHVTMWANLDEQGWRRRRQSTAADGHFGAVEGSPAIHH